jgi:hypothetical protein
MSQVAPEGWEIYKVSKKEAKNGWIEGEKYYGCAAPGSLVSSQDYPSNFQQIQCQHDYIKSILSRQNVNDPRALNTTNTSNTNSNPDNSTNNSAQANAKISAANQMKMVNEFNRQQTESNTKFNLVNPMISTLSKNKFNKENANRRKQNFKALQERSKYTPKNPVIPNEFNVVNPMKSKLSKNELDKLDKKMVNTRKKIITNRRQNFNALREKLKYTRKNPVIPAQSNQSRKGFVGRQRKSKSRNTQKKRK